MNKYHEGNYKNASKSRTKIRPNVPKHPHGLRDELIVRWLQNYHEPKSALIPLSILQYNIRYFYSNQYELLDMIIRYNLTIISLNELGTIIPRKTLEKLLFSYNIFMKQGSNN
jgi:UTP:GlnB (protein PII) uridylyltransferase